MVDSKRHDTSKLTTVIRTGREGTLPVMQMKARLLSHIIENLPVAVFCKDVSDDYRFLLWNKKNQEITGIAEEDAIGKTDYDLFSKEAADFFRQVDTMVMDRGELLDIPEEKILSPVMGKIIAHTVKVPVVDMESGYNLLLGITEDITARKQAQSEHCP